MDTPVVEVVVQFAVSDSELEVCEDLGVVQAEVEAVHNVEAVLLSEHEHVGEALFHSVCGCHIIEGIGHVKDLVVSGVLL